MVSPEVSKTRGCHSFLYTQNSETMTDESQLSPPPDQINTTDGKKMWIINDYKIWANSYQEALELLPLIESF